MANMYLSLSSVLVQSCEASEVGFRDGGSTLGASIGVGVSWVANDNDLYKHNTKHVESSHWSIEINEISHVHVLIM